MKKLLSTLLVVSMVAGLTACGGGQTSSTASDTAAPSSEAPAESATSESASTAPEASGEGGTVTIIFRDDGIGDQSALWRWFAAATETWENPNGATVDIAPIQASEGDYFAKIALMLNSDQAPDIVTEDTFQLPNDALAGYLTDMTDYIADYDLWNDGKYYESMKNGVTIDGRVYGIPYTTDTRGMWYNKEIFKAAGLPEDWAPQNWEEIFSTLATIKESNADIVPFWMNSGIATGEATSMQTYEMLLYSTGGRLMDENEEKWVVKSPEILKALNFIDRIYKEGFGPPLSKVLNGQASNTSAREYLPQGKLAVSLDGSWITGNYLEDGASPWPEFSDTLGFAAFPTDEGQDPKTMTLAGGWALSIPERSKNKDNAYSFIMHCMEIDNYTPFIISSGGIATRVDTTERSEYADIPFKGISTEFLQSAAFRPKNDKYSTVSTSIQSMVESVASGTATPEQAMEKYAQDVARAVGEENVVEK